MNFQEYQEKTLSTAIYPNKGNNYIYPLLGISGESGEICEKFKKIIRDRNGIIYAEDKRLIMLEIGDLLWYISALSFELNLTLDQVAEANIAKLADRKMRGVLGGSGNDR